ncbi:hypothetical protein [Sedimentitalea todarodis]|uniref:Uncharacterized protein n=1 Tax=Sedimentitalea todarodis TaxID=1631240 RepID=A0ABU3VN05_9RHOB|nr:hypothetical protein [Sedimentitalea todarodis]MDU9007064.1 hypothetical protein [Sedimentitalea todarodis]
MFLELIGTVFAGIAAAGLVMLLNRVTGGRLPRWAAPVAAGLAMITMTISMEYSWYSRTIATLPEDVEVAETVEKKSFYQPWTYVVPYISRFVAVDNASVKRHPERPDQRIVDLYFFGRWSPLRKMPVAFDCATSRSAVLSSDTQFASNGDIVDADWRNVGEDAVVLNAACKVS